MRQRVAWLDPSLGSRNSGDLIIRQAVGDVLGDAGLDRSQLEVLPTQRPLNPDERRRASQCDGFIVGGTNLLTSHVLGYRQWKVRPQDLHRYEGKVLLLGVGWWQDQRKPDLVTRTVYRRVLSATGHSVRDSMTQRLLASAGVDSRNTACPTMWALPDRPELRTEMGQRVVVTLTDYNRCPDLDRALLKKMQHWYADVVAWPQGSRDATYISSLGTGVSVLDEGLKAFDVEMERGSDYVGTRLHAGIRALRAGARATIVVVDNRAREIARDTGIPIVPRDLRDADGTLFGRRSVQLRLPRVEIDRWCQEFADWIKE